MLLTCHKLCSQTPSVWSSSVWWQLPSAAEGWGTARDSEAWCRGCLRMSGSGPNPLFYWGQRQWWIQWKAKLNRLQNWAFIILNQTLWYNSRKQINLTLKSKSTFCRRQLVWLRVYRQSTCSLKPGITVWHRITGMQARDLKTQNAGLSEYKQS